MRKSLLILLLVLITVSGCKTEEEPTQEQVPQNFGDSSQGAAVEVLKDNYTVTTNTNGDDKIDPATDDVVETLEGTGLDVTYTIQDSDGSSDVTYNSTGKEEYTQTTTVTNNSGYPLQIYGYSLYLQDADPSTITIDEVSGNDMNPELFTLQEDGTIIYNNEQAYNTFSLENGQSISITTTQNIGNGANSIFNPIDLVFVVYPEYDTEYQVEVQPDVKANTELEFE